MSETPNPTNATPNPISEVNQNALDELFSRDPLLLLDSDIDTIVAEFRKKRNNWLVEAAAPKPAPKPRANAKPRTGSSVPTVTLEDLGL